MTKEENVKLLVAVLNNATDKNKKALILQSFIQENGSIPDEYGEKVSEALRR